MKARRARGFSLLEVIAAILLLAVAFAALLAVAGSSLDLTARAGERSEAALWARSLLDSAFVLEPIQEGTREGRFDERYRWKLKVAPWRPDGAAGGGNPLLQMYRLDLTVYWGPSGHEREASFSTLRTVARTPDAGPGTLR
jgi:general secretion pathway protein I